MDVCTEILFSLTVVVPVCEGKPDIQKGLRRTIWSTILSVCLSDCLCVQVSEPRGNEFLRRVSVEPFLDVYFGSCAQETSPPFGGWGHE